MEWKRFALEDYFQKGEGLEKVEHGIQENHILCIIGIV